MPDLDDLKAQRRIISGRLTEVMAARERLKLAEGEETAIMAEIGALGASEVEALKVWAQSGEGEKPAPDIATRSALNDRLASAQTAATNARGAHAGLEAEQRDLASQLQAINAKIDDHAHVALRDEHAAQVADFARFVEVECRPRLAKIRALPAMLASRARHHQAEGREDQARTLFAQAAAINEGESFPDPQPSVGEVLASTSHWSARLAELTDDAPAPSNVVNLGSAAA